MDGAIVQAAKNGWLLMTLEVAEIFFFNPLTKEKIQLPDLNEDAISADFSSAQISDDCSVVVAVISNHDDYDLAIMNIKCGDPSWNYYDILLNGEVYEFSYCNSVEFEGLYYFIREDPKLLIHNPVTRESIIHESLKSIDELSSSYGEQYLLVADGKILAVFVGCDGNYVRVFGWNLSKKKWERFESLDDDKMLFISRSQSLCTRATRHETNNRIYFQRLCVQG